MQKGVGGEEDGGKAAGGFGGFGGQGDGGEREGLCGWEEGVRGQYRWVLSGRGQKVLKSGMKFDGENRFLESLVRT